VLSERTLPNEVVFIGGGVIALEFSHVYARAGAKVTIIEMLPRLLSNMDEDAVARIAETTQRLGVAIFTGAKVKGIAPDGGRFRVAFEHDGAEQSVVADRAVNGAGRVADVDGLGLDAAGVEHDRGRIKVDEFLRSVSNPAVYVCGDALWSAPQLSPVATYEGQIVGNNIVNGPSSRPDYAPIPSCVYTIPALASVGLTEAAAKEKGLRMKVHAQDLSGWLSARTYAEEAAWAKIIVDEASDRILGAHILGHSGEELIHIFALAMKHGITAGQLADTVYAFPTFSADIKNII
jgi:glutathione reductase (NADPH)